MSLERPTPLTLYRHQSRFEGRTRYPSLALTVPQSVSSIVPQKRRVSRHDPALKLDPIYYWCILGTRASLLLVAAQDLRAL